MRRPRSSGHATYLEPGHSLLQPQAGQGAGSGSPGGKEMTSVSYVVVRRKCRFLAQAPGTKNNGDYRHVYYTSSAAFPVCLPDPVFSCLNPSLQGPPGVP